MSLESAIKEAGDLVLSQNEISIISHIDADGIASEAILSQAFSRAGIQVKSVFVRQLEPLTMPRVPDDSSFKVFADLGAGHQQLLEDKGLKEEEVLILDHHISQPGDITYNQVNTLQYNYSKMSASGLCYLLAREIDSANTDLAKISTIGNVGDMMAREDGGLVGPAREIVEDGIHYGNIEARKDIGFYGLSTRPVYLCLTFHDDPFIPGISNNQTAAIKFIEKTGVRLKENGRFLVWEEMTFEEQKKFTSSFIQYLLSHKVPVERFFVEHYMFPDEPPKTSLRNAQEFATLLNACGRWSKPRVGADVCRGDRGTAYREAQYMLTNHRAVIRELLEYIIDTGVTELSHLQYINTEDRYPDTIVGIGAGMALSKLNRRKPILVICSLPEEPDVCKISMRTNSQMVGEGLDLQDALCRASHESGGGGGGHKIAAGAYIPKGSEDVFIGRVNEILREQLHPKGTANR